MELIKKSKYLLFGVILSCCGQAVASFPYAYYNLVLQNYTGRLEADDPKNDLSAEECKPIPGNANPCTVLLTPVFQRLKSDRQKLQVDLKACLDNQ